MILKATKKPVTIECVKWNGKNCAEIKSFCKDCKFELDTHAYEILDEAVREIERLRRLIR